MRWISLLLILTTVLAGAQQTATTLTRVLFNVKDAMPDVVLDVRYATTNNFTKTQLYPFAAVFLRSETLKALQAVEADLQAEGLGLKLFDGYRPLSVQQKMWDLIQDSRYVSNPAVNKGRHTRGTAIDLTLVDSEGNALDMGTDYDDFTEKAHQDAKGLTMIQAANRRKLREVMEANGFEAYPYEWWHFDLEGWKDYAPMDVSFEELQGE